MSACRRVVDVNKGSEEAGESKLPTYQRCRRDLQVFEIRSGSQFDNGSLVPVPPRHPDDLALFKALDSFGHTLEDFGSATVSFFERHKRSGGEVQRDGFIRSRSGPTGDEGAAVASLEGDRGCGGVVLREESMGGGHRGVPAAFSEPKQSLELLLSSVIADGMRLPEGYLIVSLPVSAPRRRASGSVARTDSLRW